MGSDSATNWKIIFVWVKVICDFNWAPSFGSLIGSITVAADV
jgi:hypothetical protein